MATNIRVVCRFRPQNKIELSHNGSSIVSISPDHGSVTINGTDNHTFAFDYCFKDATQREVYNEAAKPLVEDIMIGFNSTLFVYGQTSSGKTFTMSGINEPDSDPELRGIIPRMIETVFECISNADENIEFIVKASYIEIYMERIRDLLDTRKDNLKVREEKGKGVWVDGATETYIYREEDILDVIKTGVNNRAIAETKMNAESSRSHSIFILSIQQKNLKEGSTKTGKLYLVDLAGSEKISKTGAQGTTLDEAKMINKSLSSLGNVINALTDGKSTHIPYRDSKLTRVLQESLGGNSRTTLIINCSPSSYNEAETISTLRFGSRAKNIKNKAKINQERSAAELKILLSKAEGEIENLKGYIKELESVSGAIGGGYKGTSSSSPTTSSSSTTTSPTSTPVANNKDDVELIKVLQEKCIQLEKQLFKKEEEKKELLEQLEQQQEQILDKDQELEGLNSMLESANNVNSLYQSATNENNVLNVQLSELKLAFEKSKYEATEKTLTIEGLNAENQSIKSELAMIQERIANSGIDPSIISLITNGNNATSVNHGSGNNNVSATVSSSNNSAIEREDPLLTASKHADEWNEKAEQLKLLQRTPSKVVSSGKSIVGGSNAATSSPIISLNLSESDASSAVSGTTPSLTGASSLISMGPSVNEQQLELENNKLKARLQEIELEFETYKIAKENLAMQKDLEIEQLLESQRVSSSFVVDDPRNLDDEIPAEMMLQAEQIRKLVAENSEQKVHLEASKNETIKLKSRIELIEEETRQRMEEELNVLREQTNQKLSEFGSLKESLIRDLENRCQKVIDLELVLDELQDRIATLNERLKRANKPNGGDQEAAFIQSKLDEITAVKHQLTIENNKIKLEVERLKKLLTHRGEHILILENTIAINQESLFKLALNHNALTIEHERLKTELERVSNQLANGESGQGTARVARVIRGGGGGGGITSASYKKSLNSNSVNSNNSSHSNHISNSSSNSSNSLNANNHTAPTPLSANLYSNTKKSTKELNSGVRAEPLSLSGSPFNNSSSSLPTSPNTNSSGGGGNTPNKLNTENSSSSLWNIFKKKSPSSSTPSSATNSLSPQSPQTPSHLNSNSGNVSPNAPLSPPIPVNFAYTPAVVTSSIQQSSQQQQQP